MSDFNQTQDPIAPVGAKPVLPTALNVLTILTFIGCALAIGGALWQFANAKNSLDQMEELINSGKIDEVPGFMKGMFSEDAMAQLRLAYANRIPLLLINLVSAGLCLFGAIQMRKLKMQGYLLYVTGELLPFVGYGIFLGIGALTGFQGIFGLCIAALFIILYTAQRKHLVNQ